MTWLFDETSGSAAASNADASPSAQPLTLSGSVTRVAGPWAEFETNPADRAVLFASPADTVMADGPVLQSDKGFAVAAIVRATSAGSAQAIASQYGANAAAFELGTAPCVGQGGLCWSFSMRAADTATSGTSAAVSDVPVQPGKWTVVAGIHDASADTLQVLVCTIGGEDGDLQPRASATVPFSSAWDATGRFRVGAGPSGAWQGNVSEVRVVRGATVDVQRVCNQPSV